ncbi:3-coathanger stack domain-containing protein [Runella sp.]|uniref:WD40/YVTN/BNR-like repeat-containing protein n=1 Tax=Runella sp. TaxID=1960881 RepID=UPI003D0EB546
MKTITFFFVCFSIVGFAQTFTSIKGPLTTYHDIVKDNNGNLFLASHTKGVFTSTDGGQNWTGLGGNSIGVGQINALVFNNSNQLVAATEQGGVKLWNGSTWSAINTGITTNCGVPIPIRTIAIDAAGNYYAGAHSYTSCFTAGNLYKYNGSTWISITNGLTNTDINSIAINPISTTVFAGTDGGVFSYNGSTWSAINTGLGNLIVNKLTFASTGDLFASTNGGLFKLPNGTTSWLALNTGLPADAIRSVAINPTDPAHLVVGTGSNFDQVGTLVGKLYQSTDGGANWSQVGTSINSTSIRSVLFTGNTTLFAVGWGVFRSTDNGTTWISSKTGLSGGVFNTNGNIAVTASPDHHIFYGTDEGVFKSMDGGTTWQPANVGLTRHNVSLLKCDSQGNLFCAVWRYLGTGSVGFGDGVLYKSKDDGATWTPVNIAKDWRYLEMAELSNGDLICSHGFGSQVPSATIVGSSLAISHDHGDNWIDLNVLSGLGYCTAANAAGNMFVAGESNGVYRSTDAGNTFSLYALPGLNSNVGIIEISPMGDILVGAGGQRTLRFSTDNGTTYSNFTSAVLPDYKGVTDIIFDNTGKAYCTTTGQGTPALFTVTPPFTASSTFVPIAGIVGTYFKMVWDDCGYLYVYSPGAILKSTTALTVSAGITTQLSSPLNDVSVQEYRILSAATITATNKLFNGGIASYTGTKSISLTTGFETMAGSVFKAAIEGCGY